MKIKKDYFINAFVLVFLLVMLWSAITQVLYRFYYPIVLSREIMFGAWFFVLYYSYGKRIYNKWAFRIGGLWFVVPTLIASIQLVIGSQDGGLLFRGIITYYELGLVFLGLGVVPFQFYRKLFLCTSVALLLSAIGIVIDWHFQWFKFLQVGSLIIEQTETGLKGGQYRPSFLLGGTTAASLVLALMVGFVSLVLETNENKYVKLFVLGAMVAGLLAIALTLSRVGMIGACFVLLGTGYGLLRHGKVGILFFAALGVLSLLFYLVGYDEFFKERFMSSFEIAGNASNSFRIQSWLYGISAFFDPSNFFIGSGIGDGKAKGLGSTFWIHYESSILLVANEAGVFVFLTYMFPLLIWSCMCLKRWSLLIDSRSLLLVAYYLMLFSSPQFIYLGQLVYFAIIVSYCLASVETDAFIGRSGMMRGSAGHHHRR